MTMHYHGTPITPKGALATLAGRNFCVRFGADHQVAQCHEIGQSVMLDNGAFGVWKSGAVADWPGYYAWCERWLEYPTTWAVIPDVIDGNEYENELLIREWPHGARGAPVWHMHELVERLQMLCAEWPRVCIGSSGAYAVVGSFQWHRRMEQAMNAVCGNGPAPVWLHMLRGMALVEGPYPFASVDSTDVGQNHWRPQNTPLAMVERWDALQCPARWVEREQLTLEAA